MYCYSMVLLLYLCLKCTYLFFSTELHAQILPYLPQFFPQILGVLEGTLKTAGTPYLIK